MVSNEKHIKNGVCYECVSKKSKGISAERELIHKFWGTGWAAVRVAGRGAIKSGGR